MDRAVMRAGRTRLAFGMTVVLMVLAFATAASAATFYVATNGNDSNPGTETQPWRTITKAANTLVAGDTVYVKEGTYREQVIPVNSGTSTAWITYSAYAGHTVTIDGATIAGLYWDGLIRFMTDKHYIKINGFRIINSSWAGILVGYQQALGPACTDIKIENNYVSNCKFPGITAFKTYRLLISGNEVNNVCNTTAPYAEAQECISISTWSNDVEIKNNYVHDSGTPYLGGEGIDVKYGSSNVSIHDNQVTRVNSVGIYVDAWSEQQHDIQVYNNKVWNVRGSAYGLSSEAGGTLYNVNFYNNIGWNCNLPGLMIPTYGAGTVRNCNIVNNTFYHNGYGWGGGIVIGEWTAPVYNILVRNNIVSQNAAYQIKVWSRAGVSNITVDHNLIDGYRGAKDEVRGTDYVEGDPLFVDPATGNFHLRSSSPAIDRGTSLAAPLFDADQTTRPLGGGFDIGAYETGEQEVLVGFIGTPRSGPAPLTVGFQDISTSDPTSWDWDFGDGASSTEQDPTHQYLTPGRYTVSLTVDTASGSYTETKAHFIAATFPDVLVTHWACDQVLACVDANIVKGYDDGLYHPANTITRDQMAVYVARALVSPSGDAAIPDPVPPPRFSDVPADHWAYKHIEYCVGQEVVRGYEDGLYHPANTITRDQMAVFMATAMVAPGGDAAVPDPVPPATFPDVSESFWAYKHIEYCVGQEVVRGYEDGLYHPANTVTRDQMAVYVARAFALP